MKKVFKFDYIKFLIASGVFIFVAFFSVKSNKLNELATGITSINSGINIGEQLNVVPNNLINANATVKLISGVDLIPNSTKTSDMQKNTINLQKAIDNMSDNGGGTLYLPSGTFYFSHGGTSPRGEKYVIRCRNNVSLIGAGTNENSSSKSTILKPYYNNPKADGGMDMFYFNNYADTGYNIISNVTTSTKRDVTYTDMNGKTATLKNQTVYLINADFANFVIDGEKAMGGIASAGGKYKTDGKGFMINLFKDCDWDNVVVKNTDATGFGVDCPINSTMNNCKAINCGKAATTIDEGASGFGIGSGYSNDESIIITNCVSINNKKFGFFFEHQARFTNYYPATTSKGFVVANSIAGGNLYDFGGLKTFDLTFENVQSISGKGTYSNSNLNKSMSSTNSYGYTNINYNSSGAIKLNTNKTPIYFSMYSFNNYMINADVDNYVTDVSSNQTEVSWAINKGILPLTSSTKFSPQASVNRFDSIKSLWKYNNMPGTISTMSTVSERKNYQSKVSSIGYSDLNSNLYMDDLDGIVWAYNNGIISKDTKFNPSNDCTRAQFVTMLYRMAGSPSVSGTMPFTDVKSSAWYYKAVLWGYKAGIIKGSTSSTFLPDNSLKKYELAVFLYRYDKSVKSKFNITYNLLGGTSSNKTYYTKSSLPYTLSAPTKSGYTFVGWTGSNGSTPNKSVKIASGTTGDLVFTANWVKQEITLTKIVIKTKPSKLTYTVGDKLDTTGLVLTATYSDGSTKNITSGYSASPTSLTTTGTKTITVTYSGKTTTYTVKVNPKTSTPPSVSLTKIAIKTKPSKLTYTIGDKLDTTGLVLTATYSDGSTKNITSGYVVSPISFNSSGTKTVTVEYDNKSTTYTVNVNPTTSTTPSNPNLTLTKIAIKTKPSKLTYTVGDKLDTTGLVLTATYSDGSTKNITSGYVVSPISFNSSGTKTVTVEYGNKSTTYTVKVNEKKEEQAKAISIKVKNLPNQTTYFVGDKFSSNGLVLSVSYSNGYIEDVNNGYSVSIEEGTVLNKAGTNKVNVDYNGLSTSFEIEISKIKDNSLIILSKPIKTTYLVGEQFDSTGLRLEYVDESSNRIEITDGYTLSLNNRTILNKEGVITVTINYKDKVAEFDIDVLRIKNLAVKEGTVKTEYKKGESFDSTGMILIVEYTNGNKEEINSNYTVEGGDKFTSSGSKNITIKYGNTRTYLKVNVSNEEHENIKEKPNDMSQQKENDKKKTNKLSFIHVLSVLIIGAGITLFFDYYKRNH